MIADLVRRCRTVLAGEGLPHPDPVDPEYLSLASDHEVHVQVRAGDGPRYHIVMIAPDQRGLLSKAAGVLALNSLGVHCATVNVHDGAVVNEFVVSPHFGSPAPAGLLRQQFIRALAGDIDVLDMLERRDADNEPILVAEVPTRVPVHHSTAKPCILWFDGAPDRLTVEIRATDRPGLLALLAGALERAGADIAWAKVTTLGSMVDDVFCIASPGEATAEVQTAVERELCAVLGTATVDRSVDYAG